MVGEEDEGGGKRQPEGPPCDHCGAAAVAVLYCQADSARLCLACDVDVHAANSLAQRHARAPICDNCASAPSVALCAADGLALCAACDADTHAAFGSSTHPRGPLQSFSGCPSASDLAASWGFDLPAKVQHPCVPSHLISGDEWFSLEATSTVDPSFLELYVPCPEKQHISMASSGKGRHALMRQLTELIARESAETSKRRPETPSRKNRRWEEEEEEEEEEEDGEEEEKEEEKGLQTEQIGFTSLLMIEPSPCMALKGSNRLVQRESLVWGHNSLDHSPQIWDFNSGRLRNHFEYPSLEVGFGTNSTGFAIKSYSELLAESSFGATNQAIEDICETSYHSASEGLIMLQLLSDLETNEHYWHC
ncbi:zinc finger protein CONSTANS-LIKE 14-like isoform X3 [Curcuma longa]|uniref:zinc finger protein CONSTANS-LIKE 14-like isoform X3 n=1 Tax=Curcuma longa TaxID=136217 RepID=UPI003D9E388F